MNALRGIVQSDIKLTKGKLYWSHPTHTIPDFKSDQNISKYSQTVDGILLFKERLKFGRLLESCKANAITNLFNIMPLIVITTLVNIFLADITKPEEKCLQKVTITNVNQTTFKKHEK